MSEFDWALSYEPNTKSAAIRNRMKTEEDANEDEHDGRDER